jgi:hypothetical protein
MKRLQKVISESFTPVTSLLTGAHPGFFAFPWKLSRAAVDPTDVRQEIWELAAREREHSTQTRARQQTRPLASTPLREG